MKKILIKLVHLSPLFVIGFFALFSLAINNPSTVSAASNPCPEGKYLDLSTEPNQCRDLKYNYGFSQSKFNNASSSTAYSLSSSKCTNDDLQNLLNSVGASGGVVTLPACTINIYKSVQVPSNIVLQGQGIGKTIIKKSASLDGDGLKLKHRSNVIFRDFSIDGSDTPGKLLMIWFSANVLVERVEAHSSGEDSGIAFRYVDGITVRYSESYNNGIGGANGGHGVNSKDCSIADGAETGTCLGQALGLSDSGSLSPGKVYSESYAVYSNKLHDNKGLGIDIHADYGEVAGNLVYNTSGTKFPDANDVLIHHNKLYNNAGTYGTRTYKIFHSPIRVTWWKNVFINSVQPSGDKPLIRVDEYSTQIYLINNHYENNSNNSIANSGETFACAGSEDIKLPLYGDGYNSLKTASSSICNSYTEDGTPPSPPSPPSSTTAPSPTVPPGNPSPSPNPTPPPSVGNLVLNPSFESVTGGSTSTTTLYPVADAEVRQSNPNNNYGSTSAMTTDLSSTSTRLSYLKFDLSNLSNQNITSAKLRIYISNGSSTGQAIKEVANNAWTENQITYNNKPTSSSEIGSVGNVNAYVWTEIDVTNAIQQNVGSVYSLSIEPKGGNALVFNSKENNNQPELIVNHSEGSNVTPLNWSFYENVNGSHIFSVKNPASHGSLAAYLSTNQIANNVQLYQSGISLKPNTVYKLDFSAKSSTGADIKVLMLKDSNTAVNYGLDFKPNLTTSWQTFSTQFTTKNMTGNVSDGRLMFWFVDYDKLGEVYAIDNVSLIEIGPAQPPTPSPTVPPTSSPTGAPQPTATPVPPGNVILTPVADADVRESQPNNNYGSSINLTTGIESGLIRSTYFKFDLSNITANNITSAKLRLYIKNASSTGQTFREVDNNSWSENQITFNNRPDVGGTFATIGNIPLNVWTEVDITQAVKSNAGNLFSFTIEPKGGNALVISSKESSSNKPQLVITTGSGDGTVPLPTSPVVPTGLPTVAPTFNLLPMPDFEGTIKPWTYYYTNIDTNSSVDWATDKVHSGKYSGNIDSTSTSLSQWRLKPGIVPAVPGKSYTLSAWMTTQNTKSNGIALAIDFMDINNRLISGSEVEKKFTGSLSWQQYEVTATAPSGTAYIRVYYRLYGSGKLWFDDVSLQQN